MTVTRRGLLTGGALAVGGVVGVGALVEYDVLPGRTTAYRTLGLNGEAGTIPDVEPGPVDRGVLDGAGWLICNPPGRPPGLPVVIALHGAAAGEQGLVTSLGLDRFLAASGQQFAVAAISGGVSYWHPREDGSDTGRLVLEGLLGLLEQRGYDVVRPGFLGWSMGGYGALLLATQRVQQGLPVGPVLAVSPALWEDLDDTYGAFDSRADFDEYGMFERRDLLTGLDVRIDCGRGDPFFRSVMAFTDGLDAEVHIEPGAHTIAYRTRVLPD